MSKTLHLDGDFEIGTMRDLITDELQNIMSGSVTYDDADDVVNTLNGWLNQLS